jgi:hypothetical protein
MATMLPSDYPTGTLSQEMYVPLVEAERELRRASCLKALQTLRSFAIQRAHIKQAHYKHVQGINAWVTDSVTCNGYTRTRVSDSYDWG